MAGQRKTASGASRQRPKATAKSTDSAAILRWYSLGLLSGLFVAFVIYLATLPPENPQAEEPVVAGSERPEPVFDFYEVLPERRIELDLDPAELPRRQAETSDRLLLLQAGSFRDAGDADRRRAQLLLLGLEPTIEESNGDNGRWFRVFIGPFESRSAMAKARSLTAQQDIDTLMVQRDAG